MTLDQTLRRERHRLLGYMVRYAGGKALVDRVLVEGGTIKALLSSGETVPAVECEKVMG